MPPSQPKGGSPAYLLIALMAPGSVEAEVGKAQNAIFASHGFVSAVALPPLIPIGFVPDGKGQEFIAGMRKPVHSPYVFETTALAWESGGLYLSVESGGVWDGLRRELEEKAGDASQRGPLLFQPSEGFCLGCWEVAEEQRAGIRVEVPNLRFSSCDLAFVSITVSGDAEWWRDVGMEVLAKRPLR